MWKYTAHFPGVMKIGRPYLKITWYALFLKPISISHSQIHPGKIIEVFCRCPAAKPKDPHSNSSAIIEPLQDGHGISKKPKYKQHLRE